MTKRIKFSLLTFLTAIVLLIAGFLTLSLPTTTVNAATVRVSSFSIGSVNTQNQVDIVVSGVTIPDSFIAAGNLSRAGGTFSTNATYTDKSTGTVGTFHDFVGVLAANSTTFNLFPSSGLAQFGDKIDIPRATQLKTDTDTIVFSAAFTLWYNGKTWQTTEPTATEISSLTIGTNNNKDRIDLMIGNTVLPANFTTYGASANLSDAGGDFGKAATWDGASFKGMVGALTNGNNGFMLFPSGKVAARENIIHIPKGTSITANGESVLFGEEVKLWFNGEKWIVYQEPTPLTIQKLNDNSTYNGTTYALYFSVDAVGGSYWGGWDNYANVDLNGTSLRVEGICFAGANTLYVQFSSATVANPLKITEGLVLYVNNTFYKIANECSVYYSNNALSADVKYDKATLSDFSVIDAESAAQTIMLSIDNTTLPDKFAAYASTNNLAHANGTFGTSATWTRDGGNTTVAFPGQVGVLASGNGRLVLFPTGQIPAAEDKIIIPRGATIVANGCLVEFSEELQLQFNGTKWSIIEPTPMTITGLDTGRTIYGSGVYQIYVETNVTNNGATWGGWDNHTNALLNGAPIRADWCFVTTGANSLLYVQVATAEAEDIITIAKGTRVKLDGIWYKIEADFNIYHYDGGFHTEPKPVVISDFDFGEINRSDRVDLVIKDNTLPDAFAAYGVNTTNNLSYAGGTFGTTATWNTSKFKGMVGVQTNGNNGFVIFPSGTTAQAGDVLTIPKGATIKVDDCTVEFGVEVKLTFNGTKWSGVEDVVPATPMMITGLDTGRTIYDTTNGWYGIYVTTNVNNNSGKDWGDLGWDHSATMSVNGTPIRADWCFASTGAKALLYVQVSTAAIDNRPITIAKGTQITIADTTYEIADDYSIYHYWGAFYTEPKPEVTPMTITGLDTGRTIYDTTNGWYGIYVTTNVTNNGATWAGWDSSAKVSLNGTPTRADWCFADKEANSLLYVQVTTAEVANPLTIAKGTVVNINGILYEITNEFNIAFCNVSHTVNGETTVEHVGNVVDSSEVSDTFDYVLPEVEVSNSDHVGLGWLYNGTLYKAGETLQATAGNFEVEAVSTEFKQVDGASVKMGSALEGTGIRFTARFPALSEYVTHIGILVMPTDLMTKGDFTHENYTKNRDYLEFIADVSTMEMENFQDKGMAYYLKASVVSLYESNYRRYFSARSFMVVDFGNGPEYVYTDYNPVENQRRICDVADAALKDVAADKISYTKDKTDMLLKYAKGALDTYAYFGPESTDEFAHYASIGMDVVWLDMVAYRYHERYQTSWTVEQEKAFYESQTGDFDLKGAFAAARQKGLKVIVYDEGIRRLSESTIPLIATDPANPQLLGLWLQTAEEKTAEILGADANESYFDEANMTYTYSGSNYGGTGKAKVLKYMYQFESEAALKNYIAAFMSQYAKESNFYGVMLADEPESGAYDQLALVKKIIAELYPNAYAQTCQLPSYSEKHNKGDFNTFKEAIQSYAQKIQGNGELGIDYYPYTEETVGLWDQIMGKVETENGIRKGWLGTMQYVAQTAIQYNLDFENTIQSHAMSEGYTSVSAAELALQMHVSVGFGAKRLAYFTYNRHDESDDLTMTQYIAGNATLAEAVKNANAVGDNMRGAMTWFQYSKSQVYGKGSAKYLNLNHLTTSNLTKNIISSASNAVLVNEFYNEFTGEYGYYIINITIPDNNTSVTVDLTSAATVYQGTSNKKASSVTLAAGEGVFVVVS